MSGIPLRRRGGEAGVGNSMLINKAYSYILPPRPTGTPPKEGNTHAAKKTVLPVFHIS
jgi:hypothetical protein